MTPLGLLTSFGLGAGFGRGDQYWPWISLHDEAAAIVHLLTSKLERAGEPRRPDAGDERRASPSAFARRHAPAAPAARARSSRSRRSATPGASCCSTTSTSSRRSCSTTASSSDAADDRRCESRRSPEPLAAGALERDRLPHRPARAPAVAARVVGEPEPVPGAPVSGSASTAAWYAGNTASAAARSMRPLGSRGSSSSGRPPSASSRARAARARTVNTSSAASAHAPMQREHEQRDARSRSPTGSSDADQQQAVLDREDEVQREQRRHRRRRRRASSRRGVAVTRGRAACRGRRRRRARVARGAQREQDARLVRRVG